MIIKDLSEKELIYQLTTTGLRFEAGSYAVKLSSNIVSVARGIKKLYRNAAIVDGIVDFNVSLQRSSGIRKLLKPQVQFSFNGIEPFSPLPCTQAFPLFEWGLNWCVTSHDHRYLIIHAAVVEKNGKALILPGSPGAGKSTLCAALVELGGWRLLSDELTMVNINDSYIHPNPRPISLKNQSIDLIKSYIGNDHFSAVVKDTIKGSVAHIRAPSESLKAKSELAIPSIIVYPKFQRNIENSLNELSKGESFMRLAENSFNYNVLANDGFCALGKLHDRVECYSFHYDGNLEYAISVMDSLVE
ncbi:HprK-related kinase A [Thalassotalea montiporae]